MVLEGPELEVEELQVLVDRAVAVEDAVHLEVDGEAEVNDLLGAIVRKMAVAVLGLPLLRLRFFAPAVAGAAPRTCGC